MLRTWRITTRALSGNVSMPASALCKPNGSADPFGTEQDEAHRGRWQT
jgi:hypothetical protein